MSSQDTFATPDFECAAGKIEEVVLSVASEQCFDSRQGEGFPHECSTSKDFAIFSLVIFAHDLVDALDGYFFDGVGDDEFLCVIGASGEFFVENVVKHEVEEERISL